MSSKKGSKKPTYQYKTNALCVSLYNPYGETIPAQVRNQAEEAITKIALDNQLLVNIATT